MLTPLLAAASIAVSFPASAQEAITSEEVAEQMCAAFAAQLNSEQHEAFCALLDVDPLNHSLALTRLDQAMELIPVPSPTNALLHTFRAAILLRLDNEAEAAKVFSDAIDIYRGFPPLLFSAVNALGYTAYAGDAADYWVDLAEVDPEGARRIEGAVLSSIIQQLESRSDYNRIGALVDALDAIDYDGNDPIAKVTVAEMVVDQAIYRADLARAREHLPDVLSPSGMEYILTDLEYRALWEDVPWSDPDQREAVIANWLNALAERARYDRATGGTFLLLAGGHVDPAVLVEAYRPQMMRAFAFEADDPNVLYDYAYWVAPMANAQWNSGDLAGAEETYQVALDAFTRLKNPARFNAGANFAKLLVDTGRLEEGLAMMEETIAELEAMDSSNLALLPMHAVRARALHGLGRHDEAEAALRLVTDQAVANPELALTTLLFLGQEREARDLIIERLESSINYRDAINYLQPDISGYRTPSAAANDALVDILRGNRRVMRALERRGRMLEQGPIRLEGYTPPPID